MCIFTDQSRLARPDRVKPPSTTTSPSLTKGIHGKYAVDGMVVPRSAGIPWVLQLVSPGTCCSRMSLDTHSRSYGALTLRRVSSPPPLITHDLKAASHIPSHPTPPHPVASSPSPPHPIPSNRSMEFPSLTKGIYGKSAVDVMVAILRLEHPTPT